MIVPKGSYAVELDSALFGSTGSKQDSRAVTTTTFNKEFLFIQSLTLAQNSFH